LQGYFDPPYRSPNPNEPPPCCRTQADKRRFKQAVNRKTYFAARGPIRGDVPYVNHGNFGDKVCEHCQADLLPTELNDCCENGKVSWPDWEYPDELLSKFDGNSAEQKRNKASLRTLNSRIALAAYSAKREPIHGRGPDVLKINGDVRVTMPHADPVTDPDDVRPRGRATLADLDRRRNGQLVCFVEPGLVGEKIRSEVGGQVIDPVFLEAWIKYLRANNKLYDSFGIMHDELQKQIDRGVSADVTLVFKPTTVALGESRLKEHQGRLPVEENEVAALFDVKGTPVTPSLYVNRNGKNVEIWPQNDFRDALTYPVLKPHGERGWTYGKPHQGPNVTGTKNQPS